MTNGVGWTTALSPAAAVAGAVAAPTGASTPAFTFLRGDHVELAQVTLATFNTTELIYDEGNFWRYVPSGGVWERLSVDFLMATVSSFAGAPVLCGPGVKPLRLAHSALRGAVEIMKSTLLAVDGRRLFANAHAGVAFANGFVRVSNGVISLAPHSADHLARHAHPFDYVQGAPHPSLHVFLQEIFADATPADRGERIALLQEFIGTCMVGEATRYQRCLVLYGEGGNGKSQVLEIGRATIPRSGVVSLPPQEWAARFQLARLAGAVANFVDEIPERDITGGEKFKAVISGEPVHCDRKNQDPFELLPKAGHIFSANTLPGTVDQSHGFWRRFVVCPFTLDMEKAVSHRPNAAGEVIAAELPAIVAWALEGAARIQRQGAFTEPQSSRTLMNAWRSDADPVLKFAATECVADPKAATAWQKMYQVYRGWSEENGFAVMSSTKFLRRLNGAGVRSSHTGKGNVYQWHLPNASRYLVP